MNLILSSSEEFRYKYQWKDIDCFASEDNVTTEERDRNPRDVLDAILSLFLFRSRTTDYLCYTRSPDNGAKL